MLGFVPTYRLCRIIFIVECNAKKIAIQWLIMIIFYIT